jgi:hypothetical protein
MQDKPDIRQKKGERKVARHAIIRSKCGAGTGHETRINLNWRNIAKTQRKPAVNASGAATSPRAGQDHGRCRVCGRRFEAYRAHQVYCSPRCRLMAWTCRQLVREYKAGRIPGLETEISRLR